MKVSRVEKLLAILIFLHMGTSVITMQTKVAPKQQHTQATSPLTPTPPTPTKKTKKTAQQKQ